MSQERGPVARTETPAPVVQRAAVEAPTPAAPVPLPVGGLVVGHAEDRAEADADRMADVALARLRRTEAGAAGGDGADVHQHGPGCDHVRRSAAPSGNPVVGYEGGALDSGTSSAIESRRGSGKPLDGDVKRRMETAFGTSLSGVRIHTDDTSAKLNTAVSARAFTTGQDVFFGKGQYAPGTPSGDRVLAHELAHTLQPGGSAQRLVATSARGGELSPRARAAVHRSVATSEVVVRRGFLDFFRGKKKEDKGAAPQPEAEAAPRARAQTLVAPAPSPYGANVAGKLPSVLEEGGKAGTVGGVVGGAQIATMSTSALGVSGVVGASAGLLTTVDALTGLNNARKMGNDAAEFGDAGMGNLSDRKYKNQGVQALTGAASTAKGGVEMAYLASGGLTSAKNVAAGVGNATMGAAAGGLGIATGAIQTLQGLHKAGKAVQKLCRLHWGRAKTMYSQRGQGWKAAIMGSEKFKLGMAAVKTALGVLGIAAGALLLASNPVGWGIGIAAAIVGGVMAGRKIYLKVQDARQRAAIAKQIDAEADPVVAVGVPGPGLDVDGPQDPAPVAPPAPTAKQTIAENTTKAIGRRKVSDKEKARIAAIERANEVARRASQYAVVASELRGAVDTRGNEASLTQFINAYNGLLVNENYDVAGTLTTESSREFFDAYQLLSSINVSTEEARSDSGQELIEKKLSKMESM